MAERRTSTSKSGGSARKASGSAKSRSSSASRSTKRSAAAKKGGQARGRQQTAQKRAAQTAGAATKPAELSGKSVADLRNALSRGVIAPLNLVMLTRDRIEEVMEDAVSRGRMTADDAQKLAQDLINRGRKQTNDVLGDLEGLLARAGDPVGARKRGSDAAGRARRYRAAARVVIAALGDGLDVGHQLAVGHRVDREPRRLSGELKLTGVEVQLSLDVGAWNDHEGRARERGGHRPMQVAGHQPPHLLVPRDDLSERAAISIGQPDLVPRRYACQERRVVHRD